MCKNCTEEIDWAKGNSNIKRKLKAFQTDGADVYHNNNTTHHRNVATEADLTANFLSNFKDFASEYNP